jgi:hypothetical protein
MLLPVIDWKELFQNRGIKIAAICAAAVAALGGIAVGGYYLWPEPGPKPPPPASATVDQSIDYAASGDFGRLPMNKRVAWVEGQINKLANMDDDEFIRTWRETDQATKNRIASNMRDVMRERMKRHVDEYFALPKDEREAFIDGRLDEMKQFESKFRMMRGRRPRDQEGERPPTTQPTDEAHRQEHRMMSARFLSDAYSFMNNESADRRTKTFKFFSDVNRRRTERGELNIFGRRVGPRQPRQEGTQ